MSPEEQLRALKDPERWSEVRVPRTARALASAPRRIRWSTPAVAAFVVAVAAVAGIGIAFGSIPHGAAPAAGGTSSPGVNPAPCASAQLVVRVDGYAPSDDYWFEAMTVTNSGDPCALPTSSFSVAGTPAVDGWGTIGGATTIPSGTSQLYLQSALPCEGRGLTQLRSTHPPFPPVLLRIAGSVRAVGDFPALPCAPPVVGQVSAGPPIPAAELAIDAAEDARILAARATAAPKAPDPPATSISPSTPPVPAVACTAAQLTVRGGVPGALAGDWGDLIVVRNAGSACLLPVTSFSVGAFVARGPAEPFAIRSGSSDLYLMTPNECPDQTSANIRDHRVNASPMRLRIDGSVQVIGAFPTLTCEGPSIGQ